MPRKGKRQEPERDKRYHNTELLLWRYRDVKWSLEVAKARSERSFEKETGSTVDKYLDSLYLAGIDFSGSKLERRANELKMNAEMLEILDDTIQTLREKHRFGEEYFWVLYYTFLSPKEYSLEETLAELEKHMRDVSTRTYYRRRHEAVHMVSVLLWGYAEKSTEDLLNEVLQNENEQPGNLDGGK